MTALPPALIARLVAALLWTLVAGAAAASVAAVAVAAGARAEDPPAVPDPTAAEALAQLALLAFLAAPQDGGEALQRLAPTDADLADVVADGGAAVATLVAGSRPAGEAAWEVVVVVTAAGAPPRAYAVTVLDDGRSLAVQGLPRRTHLRATAAPPGSSLPPLDRPPPDDPVVAAATGFLRAYYSGTGELDRFSGPGSGLRAVAPPPYRDVTVQRWSAAAPSDSTVLALAEVRGTAPRLVEVTQVPLLLARRDSRWEVVDLPAALPIP